MPDRPQKITFADMRDMGVRGSPMWLSQSLGVSNANDYGGADRVFLQLDGSPTVEGLERQKRCVSMAPTNNKV
jgi:hypothetical protein